MAKKSNLQKYQIITSGNMALASITSSVTNIQILDNIGIQFNWSGASPVGVLDVQISADYDQDFMGNVKDAGHWVTVSPLSSVVSGSPGSTYLDINGLSAPWIRIVYTRTSGTGTLNAFITAKVI